MPDAPASTLDAIIAKALPFEWHPGRDVIVAAVRDALLAEGRIQWLRGVPDSRGMRRRGMERSFVITLPVGVADPPRPSPAIVTELVQRLVLVLASVRREKRREARASRRLHADLDAARARFDRDVGLALDRWLASRGFF